MGFLSLLKQTSPGTPGADIGRIYVDSADGKVKLRLEDGQDYILNSSTFDKNLLINGGFDFWQRTTPGTGFSVGGSTTARTFGADQWAGTASAANFTVQRVDTNTSPESGLLARYYSRAIKTTGTGKIALSQCIEGHPAMAVRGRKLRLQAKMRRAVASSMTIRLALAQLTSSGTIDTLPATFISAFNGAGSDPTLGTNLSYITPDANSQANGTISGNALSCALTTSWVNYSCVFTAPSNCKNLVVLFFSDQNLAVNDEFLLGEAGLFDGPDIMDWVPPPYQWEKDRCERFYEKTFAVDTAPAQNAGVTTGCLRCILGKAGATALAAQFQWRYRVEKRAAGTLTTFNPAAANTAVRQIGGTAGDLTATATANSTVQSVDITATGIGTGAVGDQCGVHVTCDAGL